MNTSVDQSRPLIRNPTWSNVSPASCYWSMSTGPHSRLVEVIDCLSLLIDSQCIGLMSVYMGLFLYSFCPSSDLSFLVLLYPSVGEIFVNLSRLRSCPRQQFMVTWWIHMCVIWDILGIKWFPLNLSVSVFDTEKLLNLWVMSRGLLFPLVGWGSSWLNLALTRRTSWTTSYHVIKSNHILQLLID